MSVSSASANAMIGVHDVLDRGMGMSVLGVAVVTPIKLAIGVIQAVGGVLAGVVARAVAKCTGNQKADAFAKASFEHMKMGAFEAGLAVINIVTLGLFGIVLFANALQESKPA